MVAKIPIIVELGEGFWREAKETVPDGHIEDFMSYRVFITPKPGDCEDDCDTPDGIYQIYAIDKTIFIEPEEMKAQHRLNALGELFTFLRNFIN